MLVAGALAAALALVLAFTVVLPRLTGTDSNAPDAVAAQARGADEEPERAWNFAEPGMGAGNVVFGGDRILVGMTTVEGGSSELIALDEDGKEKWRASQPEGYPEFQFVGGDDRVLVSWFEEDADTITVQLLDASDGREIWQQRSVAPTVVGDTAVTWEYVDEGAVLHGMDLDSGEPTWTYETEQVSFNRHVLLALEDSTITRVDPENGEELWSTDTELDLGEDYAVVSAYVGDTALAAKGEYEVAALDLDSGAILWAKQDSGVNNGFFGDLLMLESTSDDEYEDGEVTFYDREGEAVGRVVVDSDDYFFAEPLSIEGDPYLYDSGGDRLIDASLEVIDNFGSSTTLTGVSNGFYALTDGVLEFRDVDETSPKWSKTLGGSDDSFVIRPVDDLILVVSDDLTAYR